MSYYLIANDFIYYIAHSAGAVEYTDCTSPGWLDPSKECQGYNTVQSAGGVPVMLGLWENHPFVAIAPKTTSVQCGIT